MSSLISHFQETKDAQTTLLLRNKSTNNTRFHFNPSVLRKEKGNLNSEVQKLFITYMCMLVSTTSVNKREFHQPSNSCGDSVSQQLIIPMLRRLDQHNTCIIYVGCKQTISKTILVSQAQHLTSDSVWNTCDTFPANVFCSALSLVVCCTLSGMNFILCLKYISINGLVTVY